MSKTDIQLLPPPTRVEQTGHTVTLRAPLTVAGLGADPIYEAVQTELGATPAIDGPATISLLAADDLPSRHSQSLTGREGYVLTIDAGGVQVFANGPAGHLYGVMTLRQLVITHGDRLPCLTIVDEPAFPHRGQQYCLVQGHTAYRAEYMAHLVPQLARWKVNTLYLYLETAFAFPSLPDLAGPGAMTPADAAQLNELCQRYNITLVPMLNLLGHNGELLGLQKYHHLMENAPDVDVRTQHGACVCPSSPEVRDLVKAQLTDMAGAFPGSLIHVGGDEVGHLGCCPRCAPRVEKTGTVGLYLEYIDWIRETARELGRTIGIWGDMLLHDREALNNPELQPLVQRMRDSVVIYDWHYRGGSPESLRFFVNHGFETIACSSSHLCYTTAPWLGQVDKQRELFADAAAADARGAMTTSWMNFQGLHDEQYNIFFASSAAMLWGGPGDRRGEVCPELSMADFERAYCRLRYGYEHTHLATYWHVLGDASGPVISLLTPLAGANPRKCLFHTDNVLTFWRQYAPMLSGQGIMRYRAALDQAEDALARIDDPPLPDAYASLHAGPLIIHRHLMKRFEHCETAYRYYAQAAEHQTANPGRFAELLDKAAGELEAHLDDFPPVIAYLQELTETLGLETASLQRVQATMVNIEHLSAFLRALASNYRPLPAFLQLEDVFLRTTATHYWINREHEWGIGPEPFRRYSVQSEAWRTGAIQADIGTD